MVRTWRTHETHKWLRSTSPLIECYETWIVKAESSVVVPFYSISCILLWEIIHSNFAIWIETTHLLQTLNNYVAENFATNESEMVKHENELHKYWKWPIVQSYFTIKLYNHYFINLVNQQSHILDVCSFFPFQYFLALVV